MNDNNGGKKKRNEIRNDVGTVPPVVCAVFYACIMRVGADYSNCKT